MVAQDEKRNMKTFVRLLTLSLLTTHSSALFGKAPTEIPTLAPVLESGPSAPSGDEFAQPPKPVSSPSISSEDTLTQTSGSPVSGPSATSEADFVPIFLNQPTSAPTLLTRPSEAPIDTPSYTPTLTADGGFGNVTSGVPSDVPSEMPSSAPSAISKIEASTHQPTTSSDAPSDLPSDFPSDTSSDVSSDIPSDFPSDSSSDVPSDTPSDLPYGFLSDSISDVPSDIPSDSPSLSTIFSSEYPSVVPSGQLLPEGIVDSYTICGSWSESSLEQADVTLSTYVYSLQFAESPVDILNITHSLEKLIENELVERLCGYFSFSLAIAATPDDFATGECLKRAILN